MAMDLKQITHSMFRKRFERTNGCKELEPYFYRFIGVDDISNYNDVIRTLEDKCIEHKDQCIIFDNNMPLEGELELIQYIYNELNAMDIRNMQNADIVLFDDLQVNMMFLKALDYVIPLAVSKENFFNDNVRNNFITKLIVWTYTFARSMKYNEDINPKCIYYGTIGRHEIYFLILLYLMGFDVVYINPLKEEFWEEIEENNLSQCERSMGILNIESFTERASKGKVIDNVETITKQIERDVEEQLFENTGMFKPWQFRKGYTKSVLLDTILEDIYIYWNEPCKLRDGFKVEGKCVKVPCFFKKIDGQYANAFEYQKLVRYCVNSPNTLFSNDGNISREVGVTDNMYELMFCQLSDGTFDIDEIKKMTIYKFGKYSEEVQNFLLKKFNETITDKSIYVKQLNKDDILKLLVLVLSLDERIVRFIDNFDFTAQVPKIVIYLNNEDGISESMSMLLGYLHVIGMDIVIFNPSGLFNINNVLKEDIINIIRLDEMNYTSKYKSIMSLKQSVFSRLLNK